MKTASVLIVAAALLFAASAVLARGSEWVYQPDPFGGKGGTVRDTKGLYKPIKVKDEKAGEQMVKALTKAEAGEGNHERPPQDNK